MRPSGLSQRFAIAMPLRRERDPGLLAARLAAIFLSVDNQSTIRESSCPAARLMADGRRGPPTGTEPDVSGSSTGVRSSDVGYLSPRRGQATDIPRGRGSHFFGSDSDLEVFSRNPTDGSFAPSARRPSTRTKRLRLWFLSY